MSGRRGRPPGARPPLEKDLETPKIGQICHVSLQFTHALEDATRQLLQLRVPRKLGGVSSAGSVFSCLLLPPLM